MATIDTASIIPLHQPKKLPLTPAQRAKRYRDRKKQKVNGDVTETPPSPTTITSKAPARKPRDTITVTRHVKPGICVASILLRIAAVGLAGVGLTMNGWFAHSLGSSDVAGYLFLGVGVAADAVALAVPTCAARHWLAARRASAGAAWLIWLAAFIFAVIAGIGFAATNISDVTASRASRVTPAIATAQAGLTDAMQARDRECKGGVGKNCRQREEAVVERRAALETAMRAVEQQADPQTEAATRMVSWLTAGWVTPTGNDFAMVRLILLALLPQIGGLLLMVARRP